jgi:hypothetical protein
MLIVKFLAAIIKEGCFLAIVGGKRVSPDVSWMT